MADPATAALHAQAHLHSRGVIEIKCTGYLQPEDTAYLPSLARLIEAETAPVSIVFDTLELEGYCPSFPISHIAFFKKHRARLHRIAVAHELKSIAFAVATVGLASHTNIKGFSSLPEALSWLRSA